MMPSSMAVLPFFNALPCWMTASRSFIARGVEVSRGSAAKARLGRSRASRARDDRPVSTSSPAPLAPTFARASSCAVLLSTRWPRMPSDWSQPWTACGPPARATSASVASLSLRVSMKSSKVVMGIGVPRRGSFSSKRSVPASASDNILPATATLYVLAMGKSVSPFSSSVSPLRRSRTAMPTVPSLSAAKRVNSPRRRDCTV